MATRTTGTGILSEENSAKREDIQEELGHAQQYANRIKELYGVVPGSMEFKAEQSYLQPPEQQTDVVHVVKGVIEAETGAIEHYSRIIEETEGVDPVTNDMAIAILRDEEGRRRRGLVGDGRRHRLVRDRRRHGLGGLGGHARRLRHGGRDRVRRLRD